MAPSKAKAQEEPPAATFTPSHPDSLKLQHLSTLLHLFHHRNKNQHRRSIWYRHFSTFRKNLDLLSSDCIALTAPLSSSATHLERATRKKREPELRASIQTRVQAWLREGFVDRWWHAFSQVIADARFAVLGVVLIAVLADVCSILGITEKLEERGQAEVQGVIERFGREMREEENGLAKPPGEGEDVGVAVVREGGGVETDGGEGDADFAVGTPTLKPAKHEETPETGRAKRPASALKKAKPAKKKRKHGDAIDDLFSGL